MSQTESTKKSAREIRIHTTTSTGADNKDDIERRHRVDELFKQIEVLRAKLAHERSGASTRLKDHISELMRYHALMLTPFSPSLLAGGKYHDFGLARKPLLDLELEVPENPASSVQAIRDIANHCKVPEVQFSTIDVDALHNFLSSLTCDDIADKEQFVKHTNKILKATNLRLKVEGIEGYCFLYLSVPRPGVGYIQFASSAKGVRSRLGKSKFDIVPGPPLRLIDLAE